MSLTGRPRVIVNGVRRMRTFHCLWCLNCQRAVRIPFTNPNGSLCPYCFHQLRYELDISRPRLLMNNMPNNFEPSPATQLMNDLSLILDPPSLRSRVLNSGSYQTTIADHNDHNWRHRATTAPTQPQPQPRFNTRQDNNHLNTTTQWETEDEDSLNLQTWITLRFVRPTRPPRQYIPLPQANDTTTPFENTLDDFIDGVIQNNRPGPPPTSSSAIAALPMMKLTQAHLASDPNCPICKDEFQVDEEVKELPCKHFYHSDCILPWLHIHNTCPVCRYELQGVANGNYHSQNENEQSFGFEEVTSSLNWIWNQLVSFRPIRALLDWTHRHYQENHASGRGGSSWWRALLVL